MESREFKHNRYLDKLEKHKVSAEEACKYSSDRFDILLVSLSTSALVLSLAFAKDFVKNDPNVDPTVLEISWILFSSSLILNLLSQVTGYYSNIFDIKVTRNMIREERGKAMKGDQKKLQDRCDLFNAWTIFLNGSSLACLITGIAVLLIFFIHNI